MQKQKFTKRSIKVPFYIVRDTMFSINKYLLPGENRIIQLLFKSNNLNKQIIIEDFRLYLKTMENPNLENHTEEIFQEHKIDNNKINLFNTRCKEIDSLIGKIGLIKPDHTDKYNRDNFGNFLPKRKTTTTIILNKTDEEIKDYLRYCLMVNRNATECLGNQIPSLYDTIRYTEKYGGFRHAYFISVPNVRRQFITKENRIIPCNTLIICSDRHNGRIHVLAEFNEKYNSIGLKPTDNKHYDFSELNFKLFGDRELPINKDIDLTCQLVLKIDDNIVCSVEINEIERNNSIEIGPEETIFR